MVFGKMNNFPATAFDSSLSHILNITFLDNEALHALALF
jgi:hypothetical protein